MVSGTSALPEFEKGKSYILKGETLQQIMDFIRENRLVLTGNLQYDEVGDDGSKLPLQTLSLAVCIEGATQLVNFVTVSGTGQPAP